MYRPSAKVADTNTFHPSRTEYGEAVPGLGHARGAVHSLLSLKPMSMGCQPLGSMYLILLRGECVFKDCQICFALRIDAQVYLGPALVCTGMSLLLHTRQCPENCEMTLVASTMIVYREDGRYLQMLGAEVVTTRPNPILLDTELYVTTLCAIHFRTAQPC